MTDYVISHTAANDLRWMHDEMATKDSNQARRFIDDILLSMKNLAHLPYIGKPCVGHGDTYAFPYQSCLFLYSIESQPDIIKIDRVIFMPSEKKKRNLLL